MATPRTIIEHLIHRGENDAEKLHARYLFPDGDVVEQTYGELLKRTRQFALFLKQHGTKENHVVLIVLQHHQDMLPAFYGAMWLGAIPAFLPFPTGRLHAKKYYDDIRALVERTEPHAIVTYEELAGELEQQVGTDGPAILDFVDCELDHGLADEPWPADAEHVSCIQYSSGSTGLQKGAGLSHRAILNECRGVGGFFGMTEEDVFVTWVPLYHDWGLVCDAIHPLVLGAPFILISPVHWVGRPAVVFEAITKYKATVYWHPNFAFNFMTRRVRDEELEGIDLSSLKLCGNGAEPCLYDSHDMFARRFESVGFRREALGIVYGMAEVVNSVIGAGNEEPIRVDCIDRAKLQEEHRAVPCAEDDPNARRMLGVGRGFEGTTFKIVDDDRNEVPDRTVGEISILSECLFSGYYRNEEATQRALQDGWYFSGDMGYRADGILYVTGRKSDLIIVGGENIYPQDIEYMIAEHPEVIAGRVAAIGIDDEELGTQKLVVIAETRSEDKDVHKDIKKFTRREISNRLGVTCDRVYIAPHKWLYKTSSGKIARLPNLRRLHEIEDGPA